MVADHQQERIPAGESGGAMDGVGVTEGFRLLDEAHVGGVLSGGRGVGGFIAGANDDGDFLDAGGGDDGFPNFHGRILADPLGLAIPGNPLRGRWREVKFTGDSQQMPVPAAVPGDAVEMEDDPADTTAGKLQLIRFHWRRWVRI